MLLITAISSAALIVIIKFRHIVGLLNLVFKLIDLVKNDSLKAYSFMMLQVTLT